MCVTVKYHNDSGFCPVLGYMREHCIWLGLDPGERLCYFLSVRCTRDRTKKIYYFFDRISFFNPTNEFLISRTNLYYEFFIRAPSFSCEITPE